MDHCDDSGVGRSAGPVIILEATLTSVLVDERRKVKKRKK